MTEEIEWYAIDKKEVLEKLKTSEKGLSDKEANARLKQHGKNEIKKISRLTTLKIFFLQFKSVFIFILLAAAVFSLVVQHYVDFSVIIIIVLLNSIIGFFQQYKAEKTISEMKKLLVPKVRVFRDKVLYEVSSTELVPGDVIMISEGDKIMADCRIIHSNDIETNEAILTGESFPQKKTSEKIAIKTELANRENMLYMGTVVVKGNGKAIVVSTGMDSEFGRIAGLVQQAQIQRTPLEEKMDNFSKKIAVLVIALALAMTFIGFMRGEDKYYMILTGIALAISVIPEGIPAVIAITLAISIKRMQKNKALIRRLPAAETLGRTTIICTDKTGTLTEEEMSVSKLYCNNKYFNIEDKNFFQNKQKINPLENKEISSLLRIGILCNNARIEKDREKIINILGDPTEKALVISAETAGIFKKQETETEKRVIEYSFSSKRKLMSIVRMNNELISYVKGAPDFLIKKCSKELINGKVVSLNEKRKKELAEVCNEMASQAFRVLGFAYRKLPENFNQDIAESELVFVGFQGMMDLPRKEVKNAIKECLNAGIKIKMITGDSLLTAKAVSKMIGLNGESIEGYELEKLAEEEFDKIVMKKTIFARATPEIKLRIVQSLKKQKEIVAVTGDGVNDILALKEAHIGVAMGIRGSDVAREVSDIILLDDNFSSIVSAVKEGRRVYDNIKKSIKFHVSANFGELLVVSLALILAFPLPLMPLAILWMNLITDSLPSLALSFENSEENIMKRKPKNPDETILKGILRFILIAGLISSIATFILFLLFYKADLEKARTMALATSVFFEFFLIFTCRSEDKNIWKIGIFSNKFLVFSVLAAFALQIFAIYYAPIAGVFGFKPLSFYELLLVVGVSTLSLVFFESWKFFKRGK